MDNLEKHFTESAQNIKYPVDILNWYRNLYYKEEENSERYIMAKAINDLFEELKDKNILNLLESRDSNYEN